MTLGATVYFADKNALKGSLLATLKEVRPTIFFGVPRIYEKIQEKMQVSKHWLGKNISYYWLVSFKCQFNKISASWVPHKKS